MLELIEFYCKFCGDTYDPIFGCRCSVTQAPTSTAELLIVQPRLDLRRTVGGNLRGNGCSVELHCRTLD